MSTRTVEVESAGLLTTVQDTGRFGYTSIGVGHAGAADVPALRLANALVGNADDAAALEFTLTGPRLRFDTDAEIALTGAPFACRIDDEAIPSWALVKIRAGALLTITNAPFGCRGYLAIGGGIASPAVLRSRSEDLNNGIGPHGGRCLRAGDTLPLGPAPTPAIESNMHWALAARCWTHDQRPLTLPLMDATHTKQLDAASLNALFGAHFRIGVASNRVGCRLEGPRLQLRQPLELISAGVLPGTLQLPPDGVPIALLCEAPLTGGYPRIGHIANLDLTRLAQLRPGDTIHFVRTTPTIARRQWTRREQQLRALQATIARRRKGTTP